MAVNPNTGIDPEVDRFVVFNTSQQIKTGQNEKWPRADGEAVGGGTGVDRYYKKINTPAPAYDHRFYLVSEWGALTDYDPAVETSEGLPVGTTTLAHTVTKYDNETLKRQVDTEFQRQVRIQYPDVENPSKMIEAAGVLARKQNGGVLTADQEALLASFIGLEDAISQMRDRVTELYAAIDADEDYDITEGWTA